MESVNLKKLLEPIWRGQIVYEESLMILENKDKTIEPIQLTYPIKEVLSVYDSSLQIKYEKGKDYRIDNNKFIISEGSRIPRMCYNEYYLSEQTPNSLETQSGDYLFFSEEGDFHKKQIMITYTHDVKWKGKIPESQADKLKTSIDKMRHGEKINIVFYGDSITVGANASSYLNMEPSMPTWVKLVIKAMKHKYQTKNIFYFNTAVAGTTTQWGVEHVKERVISHHPNLVFIGFGMNDDCDSKEYQEKILRIMRAVRTENADCEFVLIAPMLPNQEVKGFYRFQDTYVSVLEKISKMDEKTAVADVTSIHKQLLKSKRYYDMTGNNVNHPNDFLGRIYAQVVISIFGNFQY